MRYAIFSDVHSNLEALEAVVSACKKESIDKYFCAGDIVGYAASPNKCVEIVRQLAMITVAGNHDWAAVDLFSLDYFNPDARDSLLWTKRALTPESKVFLESLTPVYQNNELTLVHGTLNNPREFNYLQDVSSAEESFLLQDTAVCFLGHTHIAGVFTRGSEGKISYSSQTLVKLGQGNKYIVNVGSVGQPRDLDPRPAYCVYDTQKKTIKIQRVSYDIKSARNRIIEAGLNHSLGNRLLDGR
ncbi:MAG: metallophosphoesterase family protein [Candidatus Omnitrophica bacterium]|nr:metallophosphoesterase family protein [Candidatus Omnitrophota bacterium]